MSTYDSYKHLLGRPYVSGRHDCYGLAVDYYRDIYGIQLINAARPEGWWDCPQISLIDDFMEADGWEQVGKNTRALQPGDGLIFSLLTGKANHVGVYVGNGTFIHHIWQRYSCEDALMEKWKSRLLTVVRHPEVALMNREMTPTTDLMTLLPERIRAKYVQPS